LHFTPLLTFLVDFSCPFNSFVFHLLLYPSTFSSRFIYSLSQYSNCSFNLLFSSLNLMFSSHNSLYFDAFHSFAYSLSLNNSSNCLMFIVIISSIIFPLFYIPPYISSLFISFKTYTSHIIHLIYFTLFVRRIEHNLSIFLSFFLGYRLTFHFTFFFLFILY